MARVAKETVKAKVPSKLCVRCGKVLPLTDFYKNQDWQSQSYHDAWCKDCANKYVNSLEDLQVYCHDNNRLWNDNWWNTLVTKAQYKVATDAEYLEANEANRLKIFNHVAAQAFFGLMNGKAYYRYVNHQDKSYTEEDVAPKADEATEAEKKVYSPEWGGFFSQDYLQILNDVYKRYNPDDTLKDDPVQDTYVRQIVKAQVFTDHVYNQMCQGKATLKEWETAKNVFNDLMKTANIAPASKRNNDSGSFDSLGEIAEWLEEIDVLTPDNFEGVEFPPDDVDKILEDYRHVEEAVGAVL